ncbi:MAG: DUF305 domain-containing protein [Nevskia sp.]|nr:DUF305 domain-containing protein [Nevskia sp.]
MSPRRLAAGALLLAGATLGAACQRHSATTAQAATAPGPVDIGFAQAMRSHHDQAVVMTQILLDHGTTRLASLARGIQAAQLVEIGEMKGWLLLWDKPLLPAGTGEDWMLLGKTPPDATSPATSPTAAPPAACPASPPTTSSTACAASTATRATGCSCNS